jgi:hypothetical protein
LHFVLLPSHRKEIIKGKVQGKEELLNAATVSIGKKTVMTNDIGEFRIFRKARHLHSHHFICRVSNHAAGNNNKANKTLELSFTLEKQEQLKKFY